MNVPFVVTIASVKGGVGKTTIATNLAVYLKALREELPVTIASFDNHFSVDSMFAIGDRSDSNVGGLFAGVPAAGLVRFGEYGVQYLPSERDLQPPDNNLRHLQSALGRSGLSGILILDTRPILDYFTSNALLAADLVLIPVKDRPSLTNVAALHQAVCRQGGDPSRLWLIPSIIDARLRLRGNLGIRDFLVSAARARDYQVLDTFIANSPKVEGLTTGLTSRVYPVITRARTTAVHQQFRELGAFVLAQYDSAGLSTRRGGVYAPAPQIPPGRLRRLQTGCPVCVEGAAGDEGYFFFDQRSRHRGFVHGACLRQLLEPTPLHHLVDTPGTLVLETSDGGAGDWGTEMAAHFFDAEGEQAGTESLTIEPATPLHDFLRQTTGRGPGETGRELLIIPLQGGAPTRFLDEEHASFAALRRHILREICTRPK
jgi:chromosome partitioning protein